MELISSKITSEVISQWKMGDKILVTAQTGSGKTHMVKTSLLDYCNQNDYKMLLFSNRTILKGQNEESMGNEPNISLINYQTMEEGIVNRNEDFDYYMSRFKVIVFDEIHHVFMDSQFNRRTDIFMNLFSHEYPDKILIFMTATPELILDLKPNFDYVYSTKKDYSYIDKVLFYNRVNTPESIIQNIPPDEKVIYFSSDAQEAYNLTQRFDNAVFVCSENHNLYKYSSNKTVEEIIRQQYFDARILCTTKVLDNGVNILDASVKHVIIDMLDLTSFVQCLGRRRITSKEDKITLYVKNYHQGSLQYALMLTKKKIERAEELHTLGENQFQRLYWKTDIDDIVDNNFQVNQAKYHYYDYRMRWLDKTRRIRDGYKLSVMKALNLPEEKMGNADNEYEKLGMKEYLMSLRNIKLFKDEQEDFKTRFFSLLFSPKNTNYRNRGIRSINAILNEDNILYRIVSYKETKGIKRNQTFWMILEIKEGFVEET